MNNKLEEAAKAIGKLPDSNVVEKKAMKVATIILVVAIFLLVVFSIVMANALMPVDRTDTKKVEFKVQSGWGSSKVVEELEHEHLIKNAFLVKLYLKFSPSDEIKEGTYMISKAMSVSDILDILSSSSSVENETINVTLIEGKRFTAYMQQISDTFNFNYDELIKKTNDLDYLQKQIDKYWFITDDIKNKDIKHPLEGYIFADTYNIRKNADMEEVLDTLLSGMDRKLSAYKEDIQASGKSIHSLLTLASMVELEAGTGKFTLPNNSVVSEREVVSSVFTNRLNKNMKLGSDVTTYYAVDKAMQETLNQDDLNSCNAYNTRGNCVSGLPVGPICTPSLSSIIAAIKPAETNYLYFVADKNGKLYPAVDEAGHDKNIQYLINHDLWN